MAITQSRTEDEPTTELADLEDIELSALVCPRDGTLLSETQEIGPGRIECPRCRGTYPEQEVCVR